MDFVIHSTFSYLAVMNRVFHPQALIEARARARLTLEGLSSACDGAVSPQQINRYERGRTVPRDTTIVLLADALNIPPGTLYMERLVTVSDASTGKDTAIGAPQSEPES